MNKPRLFLDVDGVLNGDALKKPAWGDWRRDTAYNFPIWWSPTLANVIKAWSEESAEVLWLTTWESAAQEHIAPLMGFPHWELAGGSYEENAREWWKFTLVKNLWETDHRPFVWIDDDINDYHVAKEWLLSLDRTQAIGVCPRSSRGLSPSGVVTISEFLARHAN